MKKTKAGLLAAAVFAVLFLVVYFVQKETLDDRPYRKYNGMIFNTIFNVTYQSDQNLSNEIDLVLIDFRDKLSAFEPTSTLSLVNQNNSDVTLDKLFISVFNESKRVWKLTDGAFDPTVSPLINGWGFGFRDSITMTPSRIDSIMHFVGMEKINIENGKIAKADPRMELNFSAIAKGYACDVIAQMLISRDVENYLVEIGGEVNVNGENPQGKPWRIGVNRPTEGGDLDDVVYVVPLTKGGMATSGNYRNYYYKDGHRVAHTIDPKTGLPSQNRMLSATVLAPTCMTADAFATAFMVMGPEKALALAEKLEDIEALFIVSQENEKTSIIMTKKFKKPHFK